MVLCKNFAAFALDGYKIHTIKALTHFLIKPAANYRMDGEIKFYAVLSMMKFERMFLFQNPAGEFEDVMNVRLWCVVIQHRPIRW